jgi:phage shock protein E
MRWRTIILALAAAAAALALYHYTFTSPWRISPEVGRVLIRAKKVDVVLDVRTSLERETLGKLPGSSHVASGDLERVIFDRIRDRDAVILVYCNTGQRARRAVDTLHELGYKNAIYIASGWRSLQG